MFLTNKILLLVIFFIKLTGLRHFYAGNICRYQKLFVPLRYNRIFYGSV